MNSLSLESLTNELFEYVVSYLQLNDIKNLRLASRSTAYKGTQDTFRSFFRAKHVDLIKSDLSSFVRLTSHNGLGCRVEDLTLVGVVYNPFALQNIVKNGYRYARKKELAENHQLQGRRLSCTEVEISKARGDLETMNRRQAEDEDLQRQASDVLLLRDAFTNLAMQKRSGLRKLSLEVMVYRDDMATKLPPSDVKCWKWIIEAASRVFQITFSCLRDTQVPIHLLDIFHKKPVSLACSMPCETLSPFDFNVPTFAPVFSGLKTMLISVSDPIVCGDEYQAQGCGDPEQHLDFALVNQKRDLVPLRARIQDETSYSNFTKMLQLCQELLELDLSGYVLLSTVHDLEDRKETMRAQYMHYMSRMPPLPHLRKLRLAGLPVNDHELVNFLKNHSTRLRDVELNNVSIERGSFKPVFYCLTGKHMSLEVIHLEDLTERDRLLQYEGEFEQKFTRISGDYARRNVMRRWGEDTKKEIEYYLYEGRSIDTGRVRVWRQRRKLEFGGR
ncbi:hypothetical protein M409DRAFT_18792 [Zasmidium cellare ATCC 36951]|uniref:F-box domain-containing protein n=1 Tax=Zasmidium cellare ATCC 36951 TaxID=1080233 RepID=A0A6A6CYD6_ZASCE|nr:uncharacterized protein M409DRAFT_18792 [Zasmidium cellare ATCC 36951]KAF2170819.1 hypothetical protein M409DRAFT_18792 [Zasmidium cellare ATCC 36951]